MQIEIIDDSRTKDVPAIRTLWLSVLFSQIQDALANDSKTSSYIKDSADRWLRKSRDMLIVCSLAGIDGQYVRERYVAGKIDPAKLTFRHGKA